jgi:protein-S-isoprenylcysteine O-methyltransferase Ste14
MENHKVVPPVYVAISLLVMLFLNFVIPGPQIISKPWNLLGILLMMLGMASAAVAVRTFMRAGTSPEPFHTPSALVTGGIYRISRNPIYFGFLLVLLGVAVLLRSVTPYLVIAVYAVLIERNVIRVEERMIAEKFGEQWVEYKKRTRRWL